MAGDFSFKQRSTRTRPRMFNTPLARVIWTLVPALTIGLAAALPFVVAAVKGVVKPWLASVYVVAEIAVFVIAGATTPNEYGSSPLPGFLMALFIITATAHTMLLDNERASFGR
ncbi:hypothetical protein ACIBKX_33460 [Streptomyces sp. NPDC050658]|uniref:hypothetical protein n=1 Tax=unclassified Streptomyces TaxID=2593676 RepID=UPI00341BA569